MMRQLRLFHLETALTHELERRQRLEWYLRELMFERQTLQDVDEPSFPPHITDIDTNTDDVDSGLTSGLDLNSYELGSGMVLADPSNNNTNSLTSYLTSPRKVTVSPAEIFGSATIDSNPSTAAEYSQSLAVCAAKLNKKLGSSTGSLPLAVQPSIRKATSAAGRRRVAQSHRLSIRKLAKSSFAFIRKFDSDRACESDDNDDYEDGNSDAEPIDEEEGGEEASAEEEEDEFTTGSTDADDESELTSQESNDSAEVKAQDSDLAVIQRWERMLKASQQKDKESSRQLRPRRKLASSFDSVGCSSSSPVSSSPSSPVTFSFEQPAIEI